MSTIKVNTIQDTAGVQRYLGRAWANWNADTVAIRSSGNISSITDHGVGLFSLNLSSSFTTAEDSACSTGAFDTYGASGNTPNTFANNQAGQRTTSLIAYSSFYTTTFYDATYCSVICVA